MNNRIKTHKVTFKCSHHEHSCKILETRNTDFTSWIEMLCKKSWRTHCTSPWHSLTEHSKSHVVDVSSWRWSKEKLSRVLLTQELKEQASGLKDSGFVITGHEPLDRAEQLTTVTVRLMSPKVWTENYRKQRNDFFFITFFKQNVNTAPEWASAECGNILYV